MPTAEERRIAEGSVLLAGMPADVRARLIEEGGAHAHAQGETLVVEGDAVPCIFVVLAGWVKLYRMTRGGAEAVVTVHPKGRSFGEPGAIEGEPSPVSAEAATDCRLLHLPGVLVREAMAQRPEVARAVLAATLGQMRGLVRQIAELKARTGAQRVAAFLLDLCLVAEGACTVTLPYEKAVIAGRLGITPESLSRAFARLRPLGVRVRHDQAAIGDVGRLRRLAEQDRADLWRNAT